MPINYISESMGHSHSESVTARYIDIFPHEQQVSYNNRLLDIPSDDRSDLAEVLKSLSPAELKQVLDAVRHQNSLNRS